MRLFLVLILLTLCCSTTQAQLFQRIKGQVIDKESHIPLEGVIVAVVSLPEPRVASTDAFGRFELDSILVGKQTLSFNYGAYQTQTLNDILVTSGKEVVLEVPLQESARKLEEQ